MADSGTTVQFCMAHLIRDIRFLAEHTNVSLARWGENLLSWLRKLFHTLHRRDRLAPQEFGRRMDAIRRGFLKQAPHPPSLSEARTLAARFRAQQAEHYFTFLTEPGVESTNNLTEQAIRHVVIDRRVTQGTRGEQGMRWCERAWTILATCVQQGRSAFQFLHQALLANFTAQPAPSLLPQGRERLRIGRIRRMARFPRSEAEIFALAHSIVAGLTADAATYPAPPVLPVDLQTLLDSFNTLSDDAVAARAASEQATSTKEAGLEEVVNAMHSILRYAENTVDFDDDQVKNPPAEPVAFRLSPGGA